MSSTEDSAHYWCLPILEVNSHASSILFSFTEHPTSGVTDVYVAVIPDFPYQAGIHVNYEETKLHIQDGLPKMKDLPKEMGGSGVSIPK